MAYSVKEIFYSLQGEGANVGRPAVFCRFSGCNLWSGRESDRQKAICRFCDTDFFGTDGPGGGTFASAPELVRAVAASCPDHSGSRLPPHSGSRLLLVVCTGGEPLLQLDTGLVDAFHERGFEVAVETNGTLPPPPGLDWITVSPKAGAKFVVTRGSEMKIVYPQPGLDPADFEHLEFDHFFLQPMDGPEADRNRLLALQYCLAHPRWKLSLQIQKYLGIR